MFNDKFGLTQAVLEGRKTMTRRIAHISQHGADVLTGKFPNCPQEIVSAYMLKAKYKLGEVVAIAQSYESVYHECGLETMDMLVSRLKYTPGWTNKMFVKSELMTSHIEITGIKVERLQDISDEDCLKEGIIKGKCGSESTHFMDAYYVPKEKQPYCTPRNAFACLIDKVSGKGAWESNPFVFAYEFRLAD